jgi:carboxypeptidase family protein
MQAPHSRSDSDSRRSSSTKWLIALLLATIALVALLIYALRDEAPTAGPEHPRATLPRSGYLNRALWKSEGPSEIDRQARERPSISGLVYDMEGSVIPGARVAATTYQLAGNIPTTAATTESDEQGRFKLELPEGSYHLTGQKDGFGQSLIIANSGDTVSLILPRSGSVHGHVYDEQHRPVQHFAIDVITAAPDETAAPAPLWSKRFDSVDGSFLVPSLPGWPVSIRATATDFAPAFSPMVAVEPGKTRSIDLTLTVGCSLTGTVEDEKGVPTPYVFLDAEARMGAGATSEMSMEAAKQTQSDEKGRFKLDNVPSGPVLIRAYDGSHAVTTATLDVGDCAKLAPLKMTMTLGGGITGIVKGGDGKPLAAARLVLSHRSVGFVNTTTDAEGRYHFEQIPAAIVRIEAEYKGQRTVVFATVKDAVQVEQNISLFAKGTGKLRGIITAAKRPLAGAQLLIASNHGLEEGLDLYYPVTGPDGTYELTGLPEGTYLVSVSSTARSTGVGIKAGEVTTQDLDIADKPPPRQPPPSEPPPRGEDR